MTAEAIARLRAAAETPDHVWFGRVAILTPDLRALLDAHTEAVRLVAAWREWWLTAEANESPPNEIWRATEAVLAKAGRR